MTPFFSLQIFFTLASTGAQVYRKHTLERRSDAHFIRPTLPKPPSVLDRTHSRVLAHFSPFSVVLRRREHTFHLMDASCGLDAFYSHAPSWLEFLSFYFIILILRPHLFQVFPEKDAGSYLLAPFFLKFLYFFNS